jgi:hypothetical protein
MFVNILGNKLGNKFGNTFVNVRDTLRKIKSGVKLPFGNSTGINNIQSKKLDKDNFKREFAEMKRKLLNSYKGYNIDCLLKKGAVKIYNKDPDKFMFTTSGHADWEQVYKLSDLYEIDPNWKYDNIQTYSKFEDLIRPKLHIFCSRPILKMVVDQTKLNDCPKGAGAGVGVGGSYKAGHYRSSRKNYRKSVRRVRSVKRAARSGSGSGSGSGTRKYRNRSYIRT